MIERAAFVASVRRGEPIRVPLPSTEGAPSLASLRDWARAENASLQFRLLKDGAGLVDGLEAVPVDASPPLVALAMIVRDDVRGLERALVTALPHVDEIVIGVDGRSGPETGALAQAYADVVRFFNAEDIGLSEEEWAADRIHFANARNHTRELVTALWTLVVDADEVLTCSVDLRAFLTQLPSSVGGVQTPMGNNDFSHRDAQRLARTEYRYNSAMHNQLPIDADVVDVPDGFFIWHDVSLRPEDELDRRRRQREMGIDELAAEGRKGDLAALFHAAKHYLGHRDEKGVQLTEYYRLRTNIHGELVHERTWLAVSCAVVYLGQKDYRRAEQWAVKALMDGPRVEAFGLLGEIAEEEGDLQRALRWFEAACAVDMDEEKFSLADVLDRFKRRDELRHRLLRPPLPKADRDGKEAG